MIKEVPRSPTETQRLGNLQGCLRASPGTMQFTPGSSPLDLTAGLLRSLLYVLRPSSPHSRACCVFQATQEGPRRYSLPLERRRGTPLDARTSLFVRFPAVWRPPEQKGPSHSFCHPLYPPSGWKGLKCPGVAKQQDRIQ